MEKQTKETTNKKEEEMYERVLILNELPTVQTRTITDNEGKEYVVYTRDEAISEMLQSIREIKKSLVG